VISTSNVLPAISKMSTRSTITSPPLATRFFGVPFGVDALRQVIRALMLASTKRSAARVVMLRAALAVTSLISASTSILSQWHWRIRRTRTAMKRTPTGVTASRSVTPPIDRTSTSTAMVSPASHPRGADRHGESLRWLGLSVTVLIIGPR